MHPRGRRTGAVVWDVARPPAASRIPGVTMAGFRDRAVPAAGHRLIPHPSVALVLDFGDAAPVVDDAAGRRHRGSLVTGPGHGLTGASWVHGAHITSVQVRLSPTIAGAVLGVAPGELHGVITVADLWGSDGARLCERLADTARWDDRFALVDDVLAGGRDTGRPIDAETGWAWRRIVEARGRVRVDTLAEEVGWSRRRLWSRFREQVGLSPKRAAGLVRFDRAVHRLAAGHAPAGVAAATGYADQSHLHREVRAFTGLTPAAVAREPFLAVDDVAWA